MVGQDIKDMSAKVLVVLNGAPKNFLVAYPEGAVLVTRMVRCWRAIKKALLWRHLLAAINPPSCKISFARRKMDRGRI